LVREVPQVERGFPTGGDFLPRPFLLRKAIRDIIWNNPRGEFSDPCLLKVLAARGKEV
jgi:hypothetical protein